MPDNDDVDDDANFEIDENDVIRTAMLRGVHISLVQNVENHLSVNTVNTRL